MFQIPLLSAKMDHKCNRSSISIGCSCSFDELFDEISTPSFASSSRFSNSFPVIHPFGFSHYSPIQLYYYKRLIFTAVDFCKSKGTDNHRTSFADIGEENRGESAAEVEEILSLLSEEVGDDLNHDSKKTFFRIRSSDSRRNEKLMLDRSSSPGATASRARSDFPRKKRGIQNQGEKRCNSSCEKDQIMKESLNFSSYCSGSSSDGDDEAKSKAIPSFLHRASKEFTCQKKKTTHVGNEKKTNASSISEVAQNYRKKEMHLQVNEIACLDKSLASFTSSKSPEKTSKTKMNSESREKIEEGRTETISDIGPITSHLQTGQRESSNMDFEVKYPLIFKETHNNQTNYIGNVHVSRTNFNPAENSHLLSSSSINIGAEKHTPRNNFDSVNETGQQSVEMRLNNHKSFTSSMDLTEEEIEPKRQYQTLKVTSFKEKLSSLEDIVNGDKITSEDKHGETFKLSSTLSSSSRKGGTLPVQIFGGCSSGGSSCTIGGDSDVSIRKTDVNLSEDPVINVHNDNSTSNIHDKDKLSRTRIVNDRQHSLNPSVNNVYHVEEHDSNKSAGVHHISTSDDSSTCRNYVLKRNGRSMWSVLSDMIRLRWSSISGSHHSNIRSCIGNLSAESAKSEEWFSVLEEQAENIHKSGENGGEKHPNKTDNVRNIEEVTTPGLSDHPASEKSDQAEAGMPPSVITEGRTTSRGGYSEYYDDDITYNGDRKSSGSTAFQSVSSTSPPTPLSSIRHLIGCQVGGSVDSGTTDSSTRDCNEVSCFVGKEGVPKQRRSKREKHVANGSFGDWEEAYTLGSEQHRIDELFMREALLESKKAADAWEVPVGAVLVHGGRIIARGFNLVEEKRDCTAHAEMICIREASNTLNSWRLAGTTLYVTLEPCPMCAGAILQARVGTLVWGAPNKIIGADGSWIRLFPDDNGGREWEMGEKPAPPVHPLHPDMKVRRLVLASECADTMQSLFQLRRRRNKLQESKPASPDPSCTPLHHHTSRIFSKIHHVFHIFCV